MTVFKELNGKKFSVLDTLIQNDLENYTIRCIILRNDNKKKLIKDIFARLNQGSVILTKQEIRHALYPGKFDEMLTELGKDSTIENFGRGKTGTRVKDGLEQEEQVLRFFALQSDLSDYDDNLQDYLDKYMENNQNISDEEIKEKETHFTETIEKCRLVFDDNVFIDTTKGKPKESFVYYDLLMWSFTSFPKILLENNKDEIKKIFIEYCQDEELRKTVSGGTLNKSKILKRRKLWINYMQSIQSETNS